MWWVVLEAAESRRIVRWSYYYTIGEAMLAASVVAEDRMRDYGSRSVAILRIDHHVDTVARQHLQCTSESWFRERMRIETYIKRSVDALLFAVKTDRLGYSQNMRLVEGVVERAAAMPGGSERDALRGYRRIWLPRVVSAHQLEDID